MSTVQDTRLTADDLLALPDEQDYELVDGRLRERNLGMESSWVAGKIARLLAVLVEDRGLGWIFGEGTGFQCFAEDPNRVRKPDVSFVVREKLPSGITRRGYCRVPPNLAVEVVSPNDMAYEVETKLAEWLDAGVPEVWIVHPHVRTVRIHRAGASPVELSDSDELESGVIPGFGCGVADLFPPLTDAAE